MSDSKRKSKDSKRGLSVSEDSKILKKPKAKRHQRMEKDEKSFKIRKCIRPGNIRMYMDRHSITQHREDGRGFLRRALFEKLQEAVRQGALACVANGSSTIDIPHMYHVTDRIHFPKDFMKNKKEKKEKPEEEQKNASGSGSGSGSGAGDAPASDGAEKKKKKEKAPKSKKSAKESKKGSKKGSKKADAPAEKEEAKQ